MDREVIRRIKDKYKDDKNVEEIMNELNKLELKLQDADILAMTVDVLTSRGLLGARSLVADARLNYAQPWKYQHADKNTLLNFKKGLPEIRARFSAEEGPCETCRYGKNISRKDMNVPERSAHKGKVLRCMNPLSMYNGHIVKPKDVHDCYIPEEPKSTSQESSES